MTIAVAGHRGRLGSWLVHNYGCEPLVCDITDPDSVESAIDNVSPNVIINCAAITAVDACEEQEFREQALRVNSRGPGILRTFFNGYFVHISTGFVFNGKAGPYREDAYCEPVNWYGWTKFGGEIAAQMREPTLIIRVLDLYGVGPKSDFVRVVRDHLELGQEMDLPDSLYKTPTYVPHLSAAIMIAIGQGLSGILHAAGSKTMSTLDWGRMIAKYFDRDPALLIPGPVKGAAKRPLRGGLNVEKARSLDIPIFSPKEGLDALKAYEENV
jgi:dTDP-4-dehydrorhamnose reductase